MQNKLCSRDLPAPRDLCFSLSTHREVLKAYEGKPKDRRVLLPDIVCAVLATGPRGERRDRTIALLGEAVYLLGDLVQMDNFKIV